MNILIVEDDVNSKLYLEKLLGKYDYKIHSEVTGDEALIYIKNNPDLDLILLDLRLPHLNGLEILKIIKEQFNHICVIVQSAYAMQSDVHEAFNAGCDGFITKPIDPEELCKMIEKCRKE